MQDIFDTLGDNMTLFAGVVGWLLPLLMAAINRKSWSSEQKGIAAFIVSLVAAVGATFIAGQWSTDDLVRTTLVILAVSQIAYQTYWRPTHLTDRIENAT